MENTPVFPGSPPAAGCLGSAAGTLNPPNRRISPAQTGAPGV